QKHIGISLSFFPLLYQERIKKFGFGHRFRGRESTKDQEDLKELVMGKPCAKRTHKPGGRNKNTTASDKNQEKVN
ncbi:hypothetical protein lerEdw1_006335, partial [Lerista edwardsae]